MPGRSDATSTYFSVNPHPVDSFALEEPMRVTGQLKMRAIVKGALTWLPGFNRLANPHTGGIVEARYRYSYSVWMRHLRMVADTQGTIAPNGVAGLDPGDSLGIGPFPGLTPP